MDALKNVYTTLTKVKTYIDLSSTQTGDDNVLRGFIRSSSRAIDRYTKREFFPTRKSALRYDLPSGDVLLFEHDILEVKGLSDLQGASEIDSGAYNLAAGADWNREPRDRLILDDAAGSVFKYTGTDKRAIVVDAIVGYHEDYTNNGWIDSGASLTASATALAQTLSVSGSLGANAIGDTPRFDEGNICRIGNEFLFVTGGSGASGITVIRGINGTTAASIASGTSVDVFYPMDDIEFATRRLAAMQYHQSIAPYTGRVLSIQFGTIENHETWPPDVKDILKAYKKQRIYSVDG